MTVATIFDAQVDTLMKKVRRIALTNAKEGDVYEAVRRQVSGELVNQGKLEIVGAAMGELCNEPSVNVLTDLVAHCSETFYLQDRILNTIVVPVGIRLKSRVDSSCVIANGREDELKALAIAIKRQLGSRKVVFDNRLYDGKRLYYMNPKKMMAFLLKLEAGENLPDGGPVVISARSKSDSEWEMVYFLGVEVRDKNSKLQLNEESIQRGLMETRCHGEWALAESEAVLFDTDVDCDTKCHGIWYLNKGVAIGEDLIRSYRLQSFLSNFELGVVGVRFKYTHDEINFQVRLMVSSPLMTVEFKWKLYSDETLEGFKKALDLAIDRILPADDVIEKREIEIYDYAKAAKENGLIWN